MKKKKKKRGNRDADGPEGKDDDKENGNYL